MQFVLLFQQMDLTKNIENATCLPSIGDSFPA